MKAKSYLIVLITIVGLSCGGGGTDPDPPPPPPPPPPQAGPPPTLTSITPILGSSAGGTAVTIAGANIVAGATVSIGGVAAAIVTMSSSSITATTAARQPPGAVDVVVRNPDGQTAALPGGFTYFTLRANTGGPYTTEGNRNITMDGTRSVGDPFPIASFRWNCGQTPHGKACDQDTPTPTFEYRQEGSRGSPDRTYTVTLRVTDTRGNTDTQTTTVTVRQTY